MNRLQAIDARTEVADDRDQVEHQRERVWFTAEHAARYLDFPTVRAFRIFARRHGIAAGRLGTSLRYHRRDLDAAVRSGR